MKNRFVFFGTPIFAELVLEKLVNSGFLPEVVICNPDRPIGRRKVITPPPTKLLAEKNGIEVFQPEVLSSSKLQILSSREFDFFVVAAYAKIIPREILEIPKLGVIGVHPSLLPKYRGASPIQSVILNGEEETGVALYLMDERMDHGPVLETRNKKIENRADYTRLLKELAGLGGDLLVETIPKFLAGEITPVKQEHEKATFTKKFTTGDAFIDEGDLKLAISGVGEKAVQVDRMIRALNPEPGTWTKINGKRIKLLESNISEKKLLIKKVQFEGKKPTSEIRLF